MAIEIAPSILELAEGHKHSRNMRGLWCLCAWGCAAAFGPLLTGLRPLAGHEPRLGITGFRLLVGPVANPPAAMQLCSRFTAARVTCRTAKFICEQFAQR